MIDTPSTVTVTIGSSLTLSCTSRGSPPDTFTWRKDNDPTVLQSTSITAVDYTSTSAVFRANYSIDSVTTSDSGTYTCTVTNPIGSDSATITVYVIIGKLLIYVIIITWAQGISLIYMSKPEGCRPEGMGIYIRQMFCKLLYAHVICDVRTYTTLAIYPNLKVDNCSAIAYNKMIF